jgi:hypothetical protein
MFVSPFQVKQMVQKVGLLRDSVMHCLIRDVLNNTMEKVMIAIAIPTNPTPVDVRKVKMQSSISKDPLDRWQLAGR